MSSPDTAAFFFTWLGRLSIVLLLVLIFLLLRGPFTKYPLILAYCVIELILTTWESYAVHDNKKLYAILYWTDEIVLNLLLFLMVITFTYRAVGNRPIRAAMGKLLGGVCLVVLLLPFLLLKGPAFRSNSWFNHTSQLLSFGAAILNFGLWTALVGNPLLDPQLLTVSAGLGIAVSGAVISYGVRGYVGASRLWLPDFFMSVTFVLCMVIWCWAFRPKAGSLIAKE